MDPSNTLITFLFETDPSVQTLQLIGSWDNFSACYKMTRDSRRGRGHWRGCHSFKDPSSSALSFNGLGKAPGLKMGQTYYYYYEVDGTSETHDSAMPSTTACPFLPGQRVNTLHVPTEHTLRKRSASLNSLRQDCFRTMDPEAKFITPRPAVLASSDLTARRLGSASSLLHQRSGNQSLSSTSSWRNFFSRKLASRDAENIIASVAVDKPAYTHSISSQIRSHTLASTKHTQTRSVSPGSLRRPLPETLPETHDSITEKPLAVSIPEDVVEDTDYDDNFATSATSESQVYPTRLSPPPFNRTVSSDTTHVSLANSSCLTLTLGRTYVRAGEDMPWESEEDSPRRATPAALCQLETAMQPRWSLSTSSDLMSPTSLISPDDDPSSIYDSNDEDDDLPQRASHKDLPPRQMYEGYRLPQHNDGVKTTPATFTHFTSSTSPRLLTDDTTTSSTIRNNFLMSALDTGEDFASEMGWIADAIGDRYS